MKYPFCKLHRTFLTDKKAVDDHRQFTPCSEKLEMKENDVATEETA